MHEPLDASTIIFAVLAIFVIWKLRSVLGARTGAEKPPRPNPTFRPRETAPPAAEGEDDGRVVRLPGAAAAVAPPPHRWTGFAEPGTAVAQGLDAIAAAEPSFAVRPFLEGAKSAYEMIVSAFAASDRKMLETLLAKDVYDSFAAAAIAAREARGETVKTTLVSIDDEHLEDAQMRGRSAQISVRFNAKLMTTTTGADGTPVGSSDKMTEADDIWTFARDVGARDPNWKLVATQTGH